eukprot:1640059-Pyramimonas_sp.AAC.1
MESNKSGEAGAWTDQETLSLLEGIELFGENWQQVVTSERANQAVTQPHEGVLRGSRGGLEGSGFWTDQETPSPLEGIEVFGENWQQARSERANRAVTQSRGHAVTRSGFRTNQETPSPLEGIEVFGENWQQMRRSIAKFRNHTRSRTPGPDLSEGGRDSNSETTH